MKYWKPFGKEMNNNYMISRIIWNDAKVSKPKNGDKVLLHVVCGNDSSVTLGCYINNIYGEWFLHEFYVNYNVLHWAYIPEFK